MKKINRIFRKSFSLLIIFSFIPSLSSAWGMWRDDTARLLQQEAATSADDDMSGRPLSAASQVPEDRPIFTDPEYSHLPMDLIPHARRFKTAFIQMPRILGRDHDDFFQLYVAGVLKEDGLGHLPCDKTEGIEDIHAAKKWFDPDVYFNESVPYTPTGFSQAFIPFLQEEIFMNANPLAQFFLGIVYQYGFGCEVNPQKAVHLLINSAQTRLYKRCALHLETHKSNFFPYIPTELSQAGFGRIADVQNFETPEQAVKDLCTGDRNFNYTSAELHELESSLKKLPGNAKDYFSFYEELASKINALIESMNKKPFTRKYVLQTVGKFGVVVAGAVLTLVAKNMENPTLFAVSAGTTFTTTCRYAIRDAEDYARIISHPIISLKAVFYNERLRLPLGWSPDHRRQESQYIALYLTLENYNKIKAEKEVMNKLREEVEAKLDKYAADSSRAPSFAQYFINQYEV
jgi:hypothetical protein